MISFLQAHGTSVQNTLMTTVIDTVFFSFERHNLTNTASSNAVSVGTFPQKMRHLLKERLLEQVIFYIFSSIVSYCLVQEISHSFELKHDFFYWQFQTYVPTKCKSFSLTLLISIVSVKSNVLPAKLTFPEFHFETEVKVDFPSACI